MTGSDNRRKGLVHLYCGDGKGKTTAAVGLILRAAGHGQQVLLIQFLKNGSSGELTILRGLPQVKVLTGHPSTAFSHVMNAQEKTEALRLHAGQLAEAAAACRSQAVELLVLDEVFGAIQAGLLPAEQVLDLLAHKPETVEVVLTGRDPGREFLEQADYISEIACVRHPYQRGINAREGIEY
jgi:cob(I)alamin adenosyltransferase